MFVGVSVLDFYSNDMMSHYCLIYDSLMTYDEQYLLISLFVICIPLAKCLFHSVFGSFLNCFLTVEFNGSLYILGSNPL